MGSNDWRKCSNLQCFINRTTPYVVSQSLQKRFIDRTTPFVASQCLQKTCIRDSNSMWTPIDEDKKCFSLKDLWDQYYEWSAYGLAVPVHLTNGETVVQYYVPHLSAIQIYTRKSLASLRNVGEDSESDSWSDDSESEKLCKSWDATSEDSAVEQDGSCLLNNRIGQLYLHYVEYCPPYGRVPLVEKISELARSYPGLTSFKSVELSPASWMSISWYPIYHIPAWRPLKDLSASFLTYHTISSSFQDQMNEETEKGGSHFYGKTEESRGKCNENQISLHPFGLATYKMQGSFWLNSETEDHERLASLYSAADSWLKQLRVQHHDFNFFTAHSAM